MNQTIFMSVFITCTVVFYTYLLLQGRIMRHFSMVDSRKLLGSQETYMRLNSMMDKGEVMLFTYSFMVETKISLSIKYRVGKEVVSRDFTAKTLDEAVNNAYSWSVVRGFIGGAE